MRFGICTGPENLDLLENLGYDYIEMNVTSVMKLTPEEQDHYRRKVEQSKVKCEAFNVLFPKTMELVGGSTGEKELRNYLKEAMTLIQSFGASLVVFGSGKVRRCPPDLTLGEGYQKLVRVYQITGEIASDYGIQVVIEPLSRGETNLINLLSEGAILESDVNMPNVGLLADFYHMMAVHDSIDSIRDIKKFGHIHIASGSGRRYPVSEENEEYDAFFKALNAVGYNGRISIEGKTENMEKDAKAALALLKNLEVRHDG
ncbi:MAG: sugar phosphate isomerase/epimerase [Clostridiales bacterium]|nr:sugar phosphate isomerase/epimerase [Clostridiales bacterium]